RTVTPATETLSGVDTRPAIRMVDTTAAPCSPIGSPAGSDAPQPLAAIEIAKAPRPMREARGRSRRFMIVIIALLLCADKRRLKRFSVKHAFSVKLCSMARRRRLIAESANAIDSIVGTRR